MEHTNINYVDLAVFGIILVSGLLALIRGFVRELLSLGAWVGASLAALYYYPLLKPWMLEHITKNEQIASGASGAVIFCAALLVLIPLGILIAGLVRGQTLTAIDRSLGFVFGLARGMLVVCLLFLLTLWLWPDKDKEPPMLAQAKTRPLMVIGAEILKTFLPKEEMDKATNSLNALDNEAEHQQQLKDLSTPVPVAVPAQNSQPSTNSTPDTNSKNNEILDQLIDKAKP